MRTDTFISIGQYCRITHRTLPLQKAEDRHTCHHCNVPPFMCVHDESRWFKQSLSCPRPEFCGAVWAGRVAASLCGQSGPSPHTPQSYTSLLLSPGCSGKCLQAEMSDNDVFPLLIQRLIDTMDCMTHAANRECHTKIISYVACCIVVCSTQRGCLQAECCVRCLGVRSPVLHCSLQPPTS